MAYTKDYNQGGSDFSRPPRKMYDVSAMNIKCADCGAEIKELPFEPDPARISTLRCRDCLRTFRQQRFRRGQDF